jgi:hypothetical protein
MREIISGGKKMLIREIKFRAWDTSAKLMSSWEELLEPDALSGDTVDLGIFEYERFKMLQFTGLKDKNGREIYEGDIFRYYHYGELNVVEYGEGEYLLENHGLPLNEWNKGGEVIGNIYENPELLNEKGD